MTAEEGDRRTWELTGQLVQIDSSDPGAYEGQIEQWIYEWFTKEIEEKAEKIKEMLRSAGMNVSFSVGIAVSEGRNMTFEVLYKKADSALYATKQRGKDGYTIYTVSEV